MTIKQTKKFLKSFKKLSRSIQQKVKERTQLFVEDPKNPLLNIHKLQGELKGVYSFNITGDYRVWFTIENNKTIVFLEVGSHSELY